MLTVKSIAIIPRAQPSGHAHAVTGRWVPAPAREWAAYDGPVRVFFAEAGETLADDLRERHRRPFTEYRRFLGQVSEVLANAGHRVDGAVYRWSQKAGCACGCSPAFIATLPFVNVTRFNVFVTVTRS